MISQVALKSQGYRLDEAMLYKSCFLWSFHVLQIMWLVDIFRAKIVDTSEQSLTIEVRPFLQFICAQIIWSKWFH